MTGSLLRSLSRLARFVQVMAPPQAVLPYGVLWVLALEGSLVLLDEGSQPWRPDAGTVLRCLTLVLVLIFMRMLDEQKDLEYDRVHHPDRPLVTGAIDAAELRAAMAAIAVLLLALNAAASLAQAAALAAALAYGVGLLWIERVSPRLRDGLIANLLVTYPVQILLTLALYVSLVVGDVVPAGWAVAGLIVIFAATFLHFEFARKTAWEAAEGERLYSAVLGPRASALVCLGLAVAAAFAEIATFRPWSAPSAPLALLPPALVLVPAVAAVRFLRGGDRRWSPAAAALFGFGTYLALVIQAAQTL